MLCSREIFTDQSYHACIRSEKNPSIRSDACMTTDYARGQPASAWPLASKPCRVDCDLHTIARAHNNTFFVRPIGTLGPDVAAVECVIMCRPIMLLIKNRTELEYRRVAIIRTGQNNRSMHTSSPDRLAIDYL